MAGNGHIVYAPLAERQDWYARVRAARAERRMSVPQLARASGVNVRILGAICMDIRWPDTAQRQAIEKALGLSEGG